LIGTNLSDVLWAKAVVLTSPFVATLGLSLTTPFAMVAGAIVNHAKYSLLYIAGALVVTGGFVVSNF
jgi:solute carrier family 35 protein F5